MHIHEGVPIHVRRIPGPFDPTNWDVFALMLVVLRATLLRFRMIYDCPPLHLPARAYELCRLKTWKLIWRLDDDDSRCHSVTCYVDKQTNVKRGARWEPTGYANTMAHQRLYCAGIYSSLGTSDWLYVLLLKQSNTSVAPFGGVGAKGRAAAVQMQTHPENTRTPRCGYTSTSIVSSWWVYWTLRFFLLFVISSSWSALKINYYHS